jgi:hypothetical protein
MTENHENAGPHLARWLGFGGLLPFVLCVVATKSSSAIIVQYGIIGAANYGAIILSFVGAIHWGLAMRADRNINWYIWSVTPALMAWAAISLLDMRLAMLAMMPAFTLAWSVDRQAFKRDLIPAWYMELRHILTAGAVLGLLLAAFAPITL